MSRQDRDAFLAAAEHLKELFPAERFPDLKHNHERMMEACRYVTEMRKMLSDIQLVDAIVTRIENRLGAEAVAPDYYKDVATFIRRGE